MVVDFARRIRQSRHFTELNLVVDAVFVKDFGIYQRTAAAAGGQADDHAFFYMRNQAICHRFLCIGRGDRHYEVHIRQGIGQIGCDLVDFCLSDRSYSVYMDNAVIADASDAFSKAFVFIQGDFIAAQGQIRCGGKTAVSCSHNTDFLNHF